MVIWTDRAVSCITDFLDNTREDTKETAKAYMRKLIDYIEILQTMPELGKKMENLTISDHELRQVIYQKHRIIYYIKNNNPEILAIIHTRLDIDKALRKLKRDMK